MKKIWEGRIAKKTDSKVEKFTSSINIDISLYLYDIMGTIAHVMGLSKIGIVEKVELESILKGLKEIKEEIEQRAIETSGYEDIHSLVETELEKKVGNVAGKIHTGRSRNDQIVLDEKLYIKDATIDILKKILFLEKSIIGVAEKYFDTIIPAFTHLQKAQPVIWSHYLLSYFEKFKRDILRFFECFENCDYLPLGSAACTGSSYNIDRNFLKEILKFKDVSSNSMDDVGSRDFIIDFIYSCSITMLHLSQFCEDLIIYSTQEFSLVDIDESFCTGSSIMPQKKNPDVLELIRGKASVVIGNLTQLLVLVKALPSTYNRDLQEDKKILFSAYNETSESIEIFSDLLLNLKLNQMAIDEDLADGFLEATDMADYLVKKGESFRKAHHVVGSVVRYCIENNLRIKDLALEKLKEFSPRFEKDIYSCIDPKACVDSKKVDCGTNREMVRTRIESGKKLLGDFEMRLEKIKKRVISFEELISNIPVT
ncbi:MAG: argininosuccinate lyase [Actinobacteria bacterium]|nr:argininosuccinate lyase [Actinomycetota bacterium]